MSHYVLVGSLTRPAPQFGAADGVGVSLCSFDDSTGKLTVAGEPLGLEDSTWIVSARRDNLAYVVTDCDDGAQSAIACVQADPQAGRLALTSHQPAGGHEGCHASVSPDGRTVFVANYGGHRTDGPQAGVAIFSAECGRLAPARAMLEHQGKGPNPDRQESPHAHCVIPSPDGKFLFVADLGIDRLVAYALGGSGVERCEDLDVEVAAGSGPRHLVFSQDGTRVYLVSELIASVTAFDYDHATGTMTRTGAKSLSSLSGEPVQPAGIVLHPDGRHVLVSVRLSEEIVVLTLDGDGRNPKTTGRFPAGGTTPRDLALSPSGNHLLVANQDSNRITVWGLEDGHPAGPPRSELVIGTPMSIAFL